VRLHGEPPAGSGPAGGSRPGAPACLYSLVVGARVVETADPAETEALGAELATCLHEGDVVLVMGELGSGKTTLVRGAARALGVLDPITSPTFSIGHRYRGAEVSVSHLDLYRLEGLEREAPELLAEYFAPGAIAFVEWPEAAGSELADARVRVTLRHAGADRRRIEVEEAGERAPASLLAEGSSPSQPPEGPAR
jgi:tRNA threonylcarbamoyladenosine biosynthesis protein TsaE